MAERQGNPPVVPIFAMTGRALADAYRAGTLTPPEVVDAVLGRLDVVNAAINAVIFVDRPGARTAAKRSLERWRAGSHPPASCAARVRWCCMPT